MRAKILCDKLYKPSRHLSTERETAQTWNPLEHISAIDVFNKLAKSSKFLSPPQKRTAYYGILPHRVQILLKLGTHVASYVVFHLDNIFLYRRGYVQF